MRRDDMREDDMRDHDKRLSKPTSGLFRHPLALVCVCVMLSGCGLGKGNGNLADGAKYQASGKYRAAYIEAKKVLQRDDKNGNAWLLLGQASLKLGQPNDAVSELQKAKANGVPEARWAVPMGQALLATQQFDELLKTLPADSTYEPQVKASVDALRGDAYRALNKNDQAQKSYEAALALDPKDTHALVGLASLSAMANDAAAADKYLQQALVIAPESPQAWVTKGDLAFNNGNLAGAEADYQKVLGFKNPDWTPQEHFYALTRLANAQAQQNKLDQALATIQTLEKMSPQQPYPHYLHAVVLYKQGNLDDALSELQQVLKAAPDNSQAQMLMGAVNYAQGNYGQAEMALSNVMGADPKNVGARKLLALTLYREGRSRQALDTMRPTVPGSPTDAELTAMLERAAASTDVKAGSGKMASPAPATTVSPPLDSQFGPARKALASGNDAQAIRLLQAMPAGDAATEAKRQSLLVMAYVRGQHADQAVKSAAEYVKKYPDESAAHLLYGTALVAARQHDKARAQYSQAYKLDPKNFAALMSLASLDSLEGHYADAAKRYDTVLKADPNNAVVLTARGQLAVRQGDMAGAVKWFNKAIAAAPKASSPYVALVMLYSQTGQFDNAVSTAKRLVAVGPDDAAALNALGAAELNAGHHAEALKPLQKAVNLAPERTLFRTNLARAQLLNKDTKAAQENLDKVIKADPGQVTAVTLSSFIKVQNHDLPGALALAQTLQAKPETKAAGFGLEGDLYMTQKSWDKAAEAYKQALKINDARPLVIKRFEALSQGGSKDPDSVLRDWLTKHPDDAATRMLYAQYLMNQKQIAPAVREYERVLKAYPDNVGTLNNLAYLYTEQHNPKALSLAEKAYKLAPQSAGVADTYGWALIAHDQAKTALPILAKAAKDAPKVEAIQYHLAVAQAQTGDKVAARATLDSLLKSGADFDDKQAAQKLNREVGGTAGSNAGK